MFTLHAKAPTRVDLTGGTLDIWPLYLLLENPVTVNLAINLFAQVWLRFEPLQFTTPTLTLKLVLQKQATQKDLHETCYEWNLHNPEHFQIAIKTAPLVALCIQYFFDRFLRSHSGVLELTLNTLSPAGAGLGGSSSLGIALCASLATLCHHLHPHFPTLKEFEALPLPKPVPTFFDPTHPWTQARLSLIRLVCDLEARVIEVPAGLQDYFAATFGGLQGIQWHPYSHTQTFFSHPGLITFMQKNIRLYYSGQSRNSGINNWEMFSNFLSKNPQTITSFKAIHQTSQSFFQELTRIAQKSQVCELTSLQIRTLSQIIDQEWQHRQKLCSTMSTPSIDQFLFTSKQQGALAAKICGAGGGGCFFTVLPEKLPPAAPAQPNKDQDIHPLEFLIAPEGLEITISR
jgi:D-glycero-alpha-D-manno-heptose-7-phosphate kinase